MIEDNPVFKEFKQAHPDAYLVHVFQMKKIKDLDEQVGYYDPKTKEVTTFSRDPVKLIASDKTFNPEQEDLKELDMKTVSVSVDEALAAAQKVLDKHYSAQNVTQEICILQHLDTQLWNLTLVTNAFNMINIRVDAASGKVTSHEQRSIMNLGTKE